MKFVKFSIFALTLGLFVASCGNNEETTTEEITVEEVTTPEPAPAEVAIEADSTAAAETSTEVETPATEPAQ